MNNRTNRKLRRSLITGVLFFLLCPLATPYADENTAEQNLVQGLPNFAPLVEKLTPVTVNISSSRTVKPGIPQFGESPPGLENDPFRDFFGDDFFRRFFGGDPNREYRQQGLGSGFIIDSEGYIITNNHVIDGADEIKVKTYSDKEYVAEVIGTDPKTDLALLKITLASGDILQAATLGDSDRLKVGEWVIAIGNPFGLQATVTAGIVSAKWRKIGAGPYEDFIQTDASINPGNSGGPLFNLHGEVVGVNTMIYTPSGGNVGIGFAIPINLAGNIVRQLKETGRVVRGWLGVVVQTVTPELAQSFGLEEGRGALVADVEPASPAEKAGLKSGDIIIEFDGKPIREMSELPMLVADTPVGKGLTLTILRDGSRQTVKVEVGELQESREATARPGNGTDQLGMSVREITPELVQSLGLSDDKGILIISVQPGSSADNAGIKKGDIIKEINRKPVTTVSQFNDALKSTHQDNILMLVKRGRTSLWIVVKPQK